MKNFATLLAGSAIAAAAFTAPAQAATTLLGNFEGNDTGNGGTGISNLTTSAPDLAPWFLAGKSDKGFGSFSAGGHNSMSGTWVTNLIGSGAFSVKAGTGYLLFLTDDMSSINWSTLGLVNGGGNTPGLSHLTAYTGTVPPTPAPEPLTILGSLAALGLGATMRRRNQEA
ncbi:PEP-CTERM sorting domain-containing protein [Prochlorothrix hollandica]|uniref:PEP-CTERM sorting domain-containing protein n=1 Tax=Prochlorothrix hollandica TaxID=1223 RepID=UPI0033427EC6